MDGSLSGPEGATDSTNILSSQGASRLRDMAEMI